MSSSRETQVDLDANLLNAFPCEAHEQEFTTINFNEFMYKIKLRLRTKEATNDGRTEILYDSFYDVIKLCAWCGDVESECAKDEQRQMRRNANEMCKIRNPAKRRSTTFGRTAAFETIFLNDIYGCSVVCVCVCVRAVG